MVVLSHDDCCYIAHWHSAIFLQIFYGNWKMLICNTFKLKLQAKTEAAHQCR